MAITEFITKGYKKLALRDIKQVKMTPIAKLQVILGTNGSGKTSLMEELSPLVSNHADYEPGGFKKITVNFKGHTYHCLSDFSGPKNHYEIIKDGVEIYAGHSSTAYNAHIKNELKITPDIHAVRIGTKRFTDMSKEARREWFTQLSPEDYSYAIKYYKRLSETTRDITGSITRINKRLLQEKERIIDAETEKSYREEIENLSKIKAEMMQHWRPMEVTVDQALGNVDVIDSKLIDLTNKFNESLKSFCNAKGYKSQDDIWSEISRVQSELAVVDSQINDIHEKIETNLKLINESMAVAGKDEASIKANIAELSREALAIKLRIPNEYWLKDPCTAQSMMANVKNELFQYMESLTPDPDLIYTPAAHKVNQEKLSEIEKAIRVLDDQQRKVSSKIEAYDHLAQADHTECPKCNHRWIKNYDVHAHEKLKKEHVVLGEEILKLQKKYDELSEHLEHSSYQIQVMNQIAMIAKSAYILAPLWKDLTEDNFIRKDPKAAIEVVRRTEVDIANTVELCRVREELENLKIVLEKAISTNGISCQELRKENESLESKLHVLQEKSYMLNMSLTGYKKAQKAMEFQERFLIESEDLLTKRSEWISKAEIANHHSAVTAVMMHLEEEIAQRERLLSQIDSQRRLINTLEQEVEELKSKEKLMKKAMSALSPSAGLIARGLTGFINHFIAQMNAVIEKVWLYPLSIRPIVITDDNGVDLDYKFSYYVDDKPAGKDVSMASGAQKEIFNLAFMLVSMVHLGLEESEIFLDEFSIKMDFAHRREAMKMVMDLVSTSNFSQIFMISHYESSYGNLNDADITVLCPDNIQLPIDLKYNINSKIEK